MKTSSFNKQVQNIKQNKKVLIVLFLLMLLPLILTGVYYVQKTRTEAGASAICLNPLARRVDTVTGVASCATDVPVIATLMCSIGLDGVRFFCGKDSEPTTSHNITIENLNPSVGYYVYIDTGMREPAVVYIPADPEDMTFALSFYDFNENVLWLCRGDEGFDPALDINQDGCINLHDSVYFFPDDEE